MTAPTVSITTPGDREIVITRHFRAPLADLGTSTKLTVTLLFPTKQDRDRMLASGMGKGVEAGYARVDELLRREWQLKGSSWFSFGSNALA